VLGLHKGLEAGNTLICVAAIHGNEPSGIEAFRRVARTLKSKEMGIRGEIVGLAGNLRALQQGRRFLRLDLNRFWSPKSVAEVRAAEYRLEDEAAELMELDAEISRIADRASHKIYVLDLHSISGPGPPFIALDDTLDNRKFAAAFPIPVVLGLEEELAGTLSGHLTRLGMTSLGFEAGQHDDPEAVLNAEAAIWTALEASGVLPSGGRPEIEGARRRLYDLTRSMPAIVEIRHRHEVMIDDRFRMIPGFSSFQPVKAGQVLASNGQESVRAPEDGFILMPLYQEQGDDGFFVVRRVHAFWLKLSALTRRLGLGRFLHLLPGIEPHPDLQGSFIVDLRKARWQARELFHLLGFRRIQAKDRYLVMSPRSPVSG
jgi:succinylglutamate desuccinylase